jgi:hypothetical protein
VRFLVVLLILAPFFGWLTLTTAFRSSRNNDAVPSTSSQEHAAAGRLLTGADNEYRSGSTGNAPRRAARRSEYNFRVAFNPRGSENGEC